MTKLQTIEAAIAELREKLKVLRDQRNAETLAVARAVHDAINFGLKYSRPWTCEHANEVPAGCTCHKSGYCKSNTCHE